MQRIRSVVTNRKIILVRARREVGNKCRLYKHFVECSFDIIVHVCEVPLNKDTHTQRGREREGTAAAVELLVHSTHTKSICAEVDDAECASRGNNHRMHYFTSRSTAVPYMTDIYT